MKVFRVLILFIFLLNLFIINSHVVDDEAHIFDLDSGNIDRYLTAGGSWVLLYYAPWCKHSQQFFSTYEQLSKILRGHVNFGKIDCINDPSLLYRFGIQAYPTIKLLHEYKLYEFVGERSVNNIISFLQNDYVQAPMTYYPFLAEKFESVSQSPDEINHEQTEIEINNQEQEKFKNQQKELSEIQQKIHDAQKEHLELPIEEAEPLSRVYSEMEKAYKKYNIQKEDIPTHTLDVGEHGNIEKQSNTSTSSQLFQTLSESKLVYLTIGGMFTAFALMAKKRLTKKTKFMKIA